MAGTARKPRVKPQEVRLTKGDQTRVVRSVDDLVSAKFDGWAVDKAGAESVAAPAADTAAGSPPAAPAAGNPKPRQN